MPQFLGYLQRDASKEKAPPNSSTINSVLSSQRRALSMPGTVHPYYAVRRIAATSHCLLGRIGLRAQAGSNEAHNATSLG